MMHIELWLFIQFTNRGKNIGFVLFYDATIEDHLVNYVMADFDVVHDLTIIGEGALRLIRTKQVMAIKYHALKVAIKCFHQVVNELENWQFIFVVIICAHNEI